MTSVRTGGDEHTPRQMPMSLDYIRVDGDLIGQCGLDAATLHALVVFRCRGEGWVAGFAEIMDDIGLPRRRAQVAREILVEAGLLECERGARSSLRWQVIKPHVTFIKPDVAEYPSIGKDPKRTNPADAPLSAPEEDLDMDDDLAGVTPIDGGLFPATAVPSRERTPAEMAHECRDVWRVAYTAEHGRPHPATAKRAFGQIGQMIRLCEIPEDFRDVWRAAQAAGAAGEWAVVNRLGPAPVSRYERPGLQTVQGPDGRSISTRNPFLAMLAQNAPKGIES